MEAEKLRIKEADDMKVKYQNLFKREKALEKNHLALENIFQ